MEVCLTYLIFFIAYVMFRSKEKVNIYKNVFSFIDLVVGGILGLVELKIMLNVMGKVNLPVLFYILFALNIIILILARKIRNKLEEITVYGEMSYVIERLLLSSALVVIILQSFTIINVLLS